MSIDLGLLLVSLALGGLLPPGIASEAAVYLWLGLFPGLALVSAWMPRESASVRIALGLAVSPVIACVAAWLLVRAGLSFVTAAIVIAMASWAGTASVALARRPGGSEPEVPTRGAVTWSVGLALVLFLIPVVNPYIFVRGDSWIHGGIVTELLERGFPPEDARMAGLKLNYVWFFNFFIALLTAIRRQDLFHFMALFNVASGYSTVLLTTLLAQRIWGRGRAPLAAAVLLTLGLNAGAFLLWPLNLLRMWTGKVTGTDELWRQLHLIHWGTARIIYDVHAPFADMISFLDKLLVGTALNFAYLQMTLWLWALGAWLEDRRRSTLILLALSAAGMMFFHSVVGLSTLPIGIGVCALAWLLKPRFAWLPERGALAAAAVASALGALTTAPYMLSITAGWAPEKAGFRHQFIAFNPTLPWSLATACFFVLWWSWKPVVRSWREGRALPILLAAFAIAMSVFSFFVRLPEHNAVKFIYEVFTPCAVLAAPAAADLAASLWRTRRAAFVVLASLFVIPTALTVHGYLVDPTGSTREELHPVAGEEALYLWLRESTPANAVVVDRGFRDLVAVKAKRRLFLGTDQPPELAAFPAGEMRRRQAIMSDLYGSLAAPDSVIAGLRTLGRPVYVVFRPNDLPAIPRPWDRLVGGGSDARVVYEFDGFHVVKLPVGAPS